MKDKILQLPGVEYFGGYEGMLKYLERKGNPLFSIEGDSDLRGTKIESLGNLTSVGGDLNLYYSKIKSLGNLTSVGGDLDLRGLNIESLGNLTSVGGYLNLRGTPLSKKYSVAQIRQIVNVGEGIYV